MLTIQMDMLQTAALAMLLFLLGRFIVNHVDFLNRCCIPAPVVGGLILPSCTWSPIRPGS